MRSIFILIAIYLSNFSLYSQQPLELKLQERGEVVVSIDANDLSKLPNQGSWSIDNVKNGRAYIYLNTKYYNKLVELAIPFIPEPIPSLINEVKMAHSIAETENWDSYPDYETYLAIMEKYATDYPDLCKLDTIGYSTQNRLLLALKISDNVNEDETEPEFFYTSSMHGNELTGYVLMLRLADYLLSNYAVAKGASLIDELEIYINPLANPDGTFADGNESVNGATRGNANNIDLNRNFPDRIVGDKPTGPWQAETIAMMEYMQKRNFGISMNFHGGREVLNYPYDDTVYRGELHPDNRWFNFICTEYVTKAREVDELYMIDVDDSGVTIGYEWYAVSGGRQDYVTHFIGGREVTCELSTKYIPPASELPDFWDKNYLSLIGYMEQVMYGIHGNVAGENFEPIDAKIEVLDHDKDSSHVRTQDGGVFYRYLKAGTYDIKVTAAGHKSQTINDVVVNDFEVTTLDVLLEEGVSVKNALALNIQVYPNPNRGSFIINGIKVFNGDSKLSIYNLEGRLIWENKHVQLSNQLNVDLKLIPKGIYILSIKNQNRTATQKLIIQ